MAEFSLKDEKEQQGEIFRLTTDTVVTHDTSEEFSLPDYVPEIRKLLYTKASVLPESKYIGDEGVGSFVEFSGTITYLLIYTDDEGNLCSLPLTSNYEAKSALINHPTTVFIDTTVDSVTPRVNAPRKVTLKSRLKSRIQGWEKTATLEKIENKSTADELFIERSIENISVAEIKQIGLSDIKFSDKLDMQGNENPRPLWCDACASVTDVKVQNNAVSVRAEAKIKCLCDVNGEIIALTKSVPIAEEIEAEGACLGDLARVSARCVSLAISNEQSNEVGQLFFDLTCELEGEVIRNSEVQVTKDCYSTKYEIEESYKSIDTYRAAKVQNCSVTVSEAVKRKGKEACTIIDVIGESSIEKADVKGKSFIVSGKLNVTALEKIEENDNVEYLTEGYEIPFKYSCDAGAIEEPISRCSASSGEISARIEGDKIYVSGEIYISMTLLDKGKVQIMDTAVLKKEMEIKKDAGCVRVYFPKEGDTLWEIAKKYHTTVATLKMQNDLSADTVEGIKNLII